MTWHAVAAVDDAVDATRRFLFPFSVVRWTKLALLVVVMGVGVTTDVSIPPFPTAEAETADWADIAALASDLGVERDVLLALGVGLVGISILLAIVSLSLRLVFYDALRTNEVRLWTPFKRRLRQAAGLFGFSLLVGLLLGGPFAAAALANERGIVSFGALSTAVLVAAVVVAVLFVIVGILVVRFTFEFVVPVMVLRDEGPIAAWRRFWAPLRRSWTQFLVYLVIHFFVALAISIAEGVVLLFVGGVAVVLAALALLVVAGVLGGLSALTGTTVGIAAVVTVVLLTIAALLVVLLPIRLVTRTYLIAYEVSTLGRIDPDLALLATDIDPTADSTADPGESGGDVDEDGSSASRTTESDRDHGPR